MADGAGRAGGASAGGRPQRRGQGCGTRRPHGHAGPWRAREGEGNGAQAWGRGGDPGREHVTRHVAAPTLGIAVLGALT